MTADKLVGRLRQMADMLKAAKIAVTFPEDMHRAASALEASEAKNAALAAETATLREGLRSAIRQLEALCSPLDVPDDARAALRQEADR